MVKKAILLCSIILILFLNIAYAEQACDDIYFLHSKTCSNCVNEKVFLDELEDKYSLLNIQYVEVNENYELFKQICEEHNTIPVGVPRTIVNGTVFIGFTEEDGPLEYSKGYQAYNGYKNQIEKAILEHLESEKLINESEICISGPTGDGKSINPLPLLLITLFFGGIFFIIWKKNRKKRYLIGTALAFIIIILFYFSQHLPSTGIISFAKQFSFPVFTFVIALLDGFNPCAFAILAILLSLLVYAQSKKKMALIGIIFILTSAMMYFLFIIMLLVLRTELLVTHKTTVRIIVGLIALTAGTINIKDFFFFKKGVSLTISKEKISKLMVKMRKIVNEVREAKTARAMFIAVIGTIILAALVNLIELGCTLILPVQYIEVLITNYGTDVGVLHYLYTLFYSLVYIIPLFAILGSFLYTFKSRKMTESKARLLKLIGGLIMIGLGLILLLKPELIMFG